MRRLYNTCLAACLAAASGLGGVWAAPAEGKPAEGKARGDKEPEENGGGKIVIPIPEGRDARGIRLPVYGEGGVLRMLFEIESARRLDGDRLEMTRVSLRTYRQDGSEELAVEAPLSVLDLNTKIVTSGTRVTVRRSDFEITGEAMEFDTEKRFGKFFGNTRMLIFEGGRAIDGGRADEKKLGKP